MTTLAPLPNISAWDDQVVPALRTRLESESAYLNDRLSAISTDSVPSQRSTTFPSSLPSSSVVPQRTPSYTSQISPRARMKSTPLTATSPKFNALTETSLQHPAPAIPNTHLDASTSTTKSRSRQGSVSPEKTPSYIPSRIPTRPRSKSQLAQRPLAPLRSNSSQSSTPSIPSSSGMAKSRSNSSNRSGTGGRWSPELGGRGVKEGLIKNELPPFKMFPDEAMRIATSGHDLDEGERTAYGQEDEEDHVSKRKRAITMRNVSPSKKATPTSGTGIRTASTSRPATGANVIRDTTAGMSRSTTGIGLGQPANPLSSSTKPRSTSSRSPASTSTISPNPNSNSNSQTRSASLNMLASPTTSRLAHLVPPEQTYKPPKGVNWDEVVIPTVAKKLAAGQGTNEGEIQEGDLAIEWDKDGTPVKWVKWNASPRLDTSVNSNSSALTTDTFAGHRYEPSPTKSRDPNPLPLASSADEPLLPPSIRQKSSYQSIRSSHHFPTPPMELSQIPPTTQYNHDEPPISPAPFSSLIPRPADWGPPTLEPASISRKPSLLKKHTGPTPVASRQASTMSIGTRYQQQSSAVGGGAGGVGQQRMGMGMGNVEYFSNPRPVPVPNLPGSQAGSSRAGGGGPGQSGQGVGQRKQDLAGHGDVKKGCGCVVM